jgi:hypothetical protein
MQTQVAAYPTHGNCCCSAYHTFVALPILQSPDCLALVSHVRYLLISSARLTYLRLHLSNLPESFATWRRLFLLPSLLRLPYHPPSRGSMFLLPVPKAYLLAGSLYPFKLLQPKSYNLLQACHLCSHFPFTVTP